MTLTQQEIIIIASIVGAILLSLVICIIICCYCKYKNGYKSIHSNETADNPPGDDANELLDSDELPHADSIILEQPKEFVSALSLGIIAELNSNSNSNSNIVFDNNEPKSSKSIISDFVIDSKYNEEYEDNGISNYILLEQINEVIEEQKLNLKDESLEKHICDALDINYKSPMQKRVQQNIFELQRQNGIPQLQLLLSIPTPLQFSEDNEEEELKRNYSLNVPQAPSFYKDIKNMFLTEMNKLLNGYTKDKLWKECNNFNCNNEITKHNNDIYKCPCIKRICVFLKIYKQFYTQISTHTIVHQMDDCFIMSEYNYTTLCNDFQHIHGIHMLGKHEMQKIICCQLMNDYGCEKADTKEKKMCNISSRRTKINRQKILKFDANALFPNKLDDIHSYFLHSTMFDEHKEDDDEIENENEKPTKTKYDGRNDKKWINTVNNIDITKEAKIYRTLVKNAGIFRWQGATGFTSTNRGALSHIKPKWKNVKEEVLYNTYHQLSMDNWAQTIIKAKEFKKTFGAERIRTQYDGCFEDYALGHKHEWKKGATPTTKEIMVIKLYTDWDELQFELKKCFRIESIHDILQQYSLRDIDVDSLRKASSDPFPDPSSPKWYPSMLKRTRTSLTSIHSPETDRKCATKLEKRLSQFFHWRGKLLIFINKFSHILQPTHYDKQTNKKMPWILYHGINAKMILNPSSTYSFYGPLSTTSSYYVAQTFATDKGMILSISSQYPRLRICNAFDCSTISDYPEEQEFLIGHIYLRVRKIYIKSVPKYVSMVSKIRFAFFAIHLFRQQMFSFNSVLENFIIPFIQIHLLKVKQVNTHIYGDIIQVKSQDYIYLSKLIKWKNEYKFDRDNTPNVPGVIRIVRGISDNEIENKEQIEHEIMNEKVHKNRLFYILTKQFEQFCRVPNRLQIIKLDCISDGLKPYFLDFRQDINVWSISFQKLTNLFENIQQVHLLNYYILDDDVLMKLIKQIQHEKNTLSQIKFIYYDYKDELEKCPYFFSPNRLNKNYINQLQILKWKIHYPKDTNQKTGYSIKLKEIIH